MTPDGPAFRQIVTVADSRYAMYLSCFLLSLGEQSAPEHPLQVTVIHRAIGPSLRRTLEALLPAPHRVRWFEVTKDALAALNTAPEFLTAPPTYWRLLAPFVLASESRAIHVDADTIVLGDLSPLWTIELGDDVVAAARDCLPFVSDAVENYEALGLPADAPYLNAGVMVINLEAWRRQQISRRAWEVCQANEPHLSARGKWKQYDQYGLNVVLHGQWRQLGPEWNQWTFAPEGSGHARIVHYLGGGKPHLPDCLPAYRRLFFDVLRRTAVPRARGHS